MCEFIVNSSLVVSYITLSALRKRQRWFLTLAFWRWGIMNTHIRQCILHGTWILERFNCAKRITECDQRQHMVVCLLVLLLKQVIPKCVLETWSIHLHLLVRWDPIHIPFLFHLYLGLGNWKSKYDSRWGKVVQSLRWKQHGHNTFPQVKCCQNCQLDYGVKKGLV